MMMMRLIVRKCKWEAWLEQLLAAAAARELSATRNFLHVQVLQFLDDEDEDGGVGVDDEDDVDDTAAADDWWSMAQRPAKSHVVPWSSW